MHNDSTKYRIKRNDKYANELQHWGKKENHKYSRKELINGKWRYFYDEMKDKADDIAFEVSYATEQAVKKIRNVLGTSMSDVYQEKYDALEDYYNTVAASPGGGNYNQAVWDGVDAEKVADHILENNIEFAKKLAERRTWHEPTSQSYKDYNEYFKDQMAEVNEGAAAQKRYRKAKKAYDRTLIGFTKKTINKGKQVVDDIIWNIEFYLT